MYICILYILAWKPSSAWKLNFRFKVILLNLECLNQAKKKFRYSTEFSNQNLRQNGQKNLRYDRTYTKITRQAEITTLYVY